jgi:hypothetical protein
VATDATNLWRGIFRNPDLFLCGHCHDPTSSSVAIVTTPSFGAPHPEVFTADRSRAARAALSGSKLQYGSFAGVNVRQRHLRAAHSCPWLPAKRR